MVCRYSDSQKFHEAKQIAKDSGMFITDKHDEYFLYRQMDVRPVFLGKRRSVDGIRQLVVKCAGQKTPPSSSLSDTAGSDA